MLFGQQLRANKLLICPKAYYAHNALPQFLVQSRSHCLRLVPALRQEPPIYLQNPVRRLSEQRLEPWIRGDESVAQFRALLRARSKNTSGKDSKGFPHSVRDNHARSVTITDDVARRGQYIC